MNRRKFVSLLVGGPAVWPLGARAQQALKLPTIGFLNPTRASVDNWRSAAFVQRLRELGWIGVGPSQSRSDRQKDAASALPRSLPSSSGRKSMSLLPGEL